MDGKTGAEELIAKVLSGPGAVAVPGVRAQAGRRRDDGRNQVGGGVNPWLNRNRSPEARPRPARSRPANSARCWRRSFEPKSDRAKEAVETAVQDPGRAGTRAVQSPSRTMSSAPSRRSSPQIDQKLSEQVNLILHHEDFQKLEGAWRGLHYLVNNTETDEMLKIRVMNISKKELAQDPEEVQGHRLGPEPDLQEDVRGGVRPIRWRALRLSGWRLPFRSQSAGCRVAR